MRNSLALLSLLVLAATATAGIREQVVEYRDGEVVLEGFLARETRAGGKRPGVLVVHQWKGLGEFEKSKVRELASLGYAAFAVDVYGKGVRPATPQEAGKQAGIYRRDRALYRRRLQAGLERLKQDPGVDPTRIGAIGFCFGGTGVLELARSGAKVAGVVSFHGGLGTETSADARNIKGKVLALHGADDPLVPDEQLLAFMKEMRDAKVDWQLVAYGGAVHAFTDPRANSKAARYHAAAARRSWQAMKGFFAEVFRGARTAPSED
jgi:dienelactone hydrolase